MLIFHIEPSFYNLYGSFITQAPTELSYLLVGQSIIVDVGDLQALCFCLLVADQSQIYSQIIANQMLKH
jgi:hypothetical protein